MSDRERARRAGYKFGYYVAGPVLFVLVLGGVLFGFGALAAAW